MSTTLPMMMDWPVEKARKVRGVGEKGQGEMRRLGEEGAKEGWERRVMGR